ncbi:hypothetical protein LJC34_05460 [Oscillospiraceae bacterium OttesenSCG-928-G22]|nr:hypothetical protein [Oscillospiraceae bacterium OttesenSCG-928-G22]
MPSKQAHVAQYKHNKQFVKTGIKDTNTYCDWYITAVFYSVLHLVDATLADEDEHPSTHVDRNAIVWNSPATRAVRRDYQQLYGLSQKSRYQCIEITDQDARIAQQVLDNFESEFVELTK